MAINAFTDTSGTVTATQGNAVANLKDLSGNGSAAIQSDTNFRPILEQHTTGDFYIGPDLVDDALPYTLSGSFSGGRAFANIHGHQIDKNVPLGGVETALPNVRLVEYVAREGAFTDSEVSKVSGALIGERHYMVTETDDLTLQNLRMKMSNSETPVLTAIGANGVEVTVTLGGPSSISVDLGAAGLTAPATVLWPLVVDETSLEAFYCRFNSLTGAIPDLSNNTSLVNFLCEKNSLTGAIPDLSNNTSLNWFRCQINSLTGAIPDLSNNTSLVIFWCDRNALTGWVGGSVSGTLTDLRVSDNDLPQSAIDGLLVALDNAGASNGNAEFEGGTNAAPSATGEIAIDNLRSRGWSVTVTGGY